MYFHPSIWLQFINLKKKKFRGSWVAQLVGRLTGSGHDLVVHGFEPHFRLCADNSAWSLLLILCVCLSLPLPHSYSLFLRNKHFGAHGWRPTSARSRSHSPLSSSPASGSGLMARSLEPVSDSVSPSLSAPPPFMLCLSLSQK